MKDTGAKEGDIKQKSPFFFSFRDTRVPQNAKKTGEEELCSVTQSATFHQKRSYLSYLVGVFRRGAPYVLYRRARALVYPAILLGRMLRIARLIFRIVETSAVLLLALTLFFVLLPPFLLLSLVLACLTFIENRRADRRFAEFFEGRRVIAFFRSEPSEFFLALAASLAGEYTVLLVTDLPHTFFEKGKGRGILAARKRQDGVLVVREQYWFRLRRRFLPRTAFFATVY